MLAQSMAVGLAICASAALWAQPAVATARDTALPFSVGEELVYRARLGRFGGGGRGAMRVAGPEEVRGRSTYILKFDIRGRVAGMKFEEQTRSWLEPVGMTALRFSKREQNPLSSSTEAVEVYPERRRWVTASDSGELVSDMPLDELSFIYFVRTLPLADGDVYVFERHFNAARNPTSVRVVRRENLVVPAGEFRTVVVEIRVKDPRRYQGEGIIRMHLSDDDRRIPVRIASRMRLAGSTVLLLESMRLERSRRLEAAGTDLSGFP